MNKDKVKRVIQLCDELKKRAKEWDEATKPYKVLWGHEEYESTPAAPRESGALRRTSLELTRALADMRRSR